MASPEILHPGRWPWWLQVVAVHLVARAASAVVLLVVARTQEANPWTGAAPSYLEYTGLMWDAGWYREIAESGYPGQLPRGDDGLVRQNAWAFFPLLPVLGRGLMAVTGQPWHHVAPVLTLVLGTAAMVLVHRVVEEGVDVARPRAVGLWTVALLTTSAASPVLQVGYTESLALLLLAGVLLLVVRRRYVAAVPLVLALGLTRAVALPVAAAVVVHVLVRWRRATRGGAPFPGRERVQAVGLAGTAVVAGFAWPVIVGLRTGVPDAYAQTQAAWRGTGDVVPFLPWLDVSRWLLGPAGPLVLAVLVALLAGALLGRSGRSLGPELRGWAAGYVGYLLLVLEPGTSLVRFALLAFPYWAVLAVWLVRGRRRLVGALLVLVGLAAQVAWVWLLWRLVPPSGWPP